MSSGDNDLVWLWHATEEQHLPNIRSKGLCSPTMGGHRNVGSEIAERGLGKRGMDPAVTVFNVKEAYQGEALAFSFATRGGTPTMLRFNDRVVVGKAEGCKRKKRGTEVNLLNCPCIPPSEIRVWQYRMGKWVKV